jgi:hypothetical protein
VPDLSVFCYELNFEGIVNSIDGNEDGFYILNKKTPGKPGARKIKKQPYLCTS